MKKTKDTSILRIRIDKEIKEEAEKILQELGIKPQKAIELLYRQIIFHKKIPFVISIS